MEKIRHSLFLAVIAVTIGIFWKSLWIMATLSVHRSEYSHLLVIPLISVFFVYLRRTQVFAKSASPNYAGIFPFMAGLAIYAAAAHFVVTPSEADTIWLSLSIVGFIVACAGGFLFTYGWSAARAGAFPLGFLLFAVPLPASMLSKIIYFLQQGSSDVAALLLRMAGVPFFREGFVFQLPGVTIEVAPECSGIRSSTALLITTLLVAQLLLRSKWRKLTLGVVVVPLAMIKNGLRIATLSVLSVYVNRDFLYGWLHHSGGVVFFLIGLSLICGILRLLQLGESRFALKKGPVAFVNGSASEART